MKPHYLLVGLLAVWQLLAGGCTNHEIDSEILLVPLPVSVEQKAGFFRLSKNTDILYSPSSEEMRSQAMHLASWLSLSTGQITVVQPLDNQKQQQTNTICLVIPDSHATAKPEAYSLEVGKKGIRIQASSPAGIFYGIQTFRQLLPPDYESSEPLTRGTWHQDIPCLSISDYPRFPWRGMMLDVSRHFFDRSFVMDFIDYLAMYKLNTFHWHLVDDQGWRIEIKSYPELTATGAWRVDREHLHWNRRPPENDGDSVFYGGYYSQDDIREIVNYAAERHITVVPEIEMPAHVSSAIAAYPWLSCTGEKITVPPGGVWPITDIYCAGKEETFVFLEKVLEEVMELFPGEYIHIGGDEATKTHWERCPLCQKRMREEKLENTHELQSYFIRRIEKFLSDRGRQLIGWDEILEGGLAPGAAVMSWRGMQGGLEAARAGHPVVMSPTSHSYFDYYQGNPADEPLAIGGYLPVNKVYSLEPVPPELKPEESAFILGAQANLWTEYISTPEHGQYMIFPRIAAISEVCWSPKECRNWEDFSHRLTGLFSRWEAGGIYFAESGFRPVVEPAFPDSLNGDVLVSIHTEFPGVEIRYTLDGTEPLITSPVYSGPFRVEPPVEIRAAGFTGEKMRDTVVTKEITQPLPPTGSLQDSAP